MIYYLITDVEEVHSLWFFLIFIYVDFEESLS